MKANDAFDHFADVVNALTPSKREKMKEKIVALQAYLARQLRREERKKRYKSTGDYYRNGWYDI